MPEASAAQTFGFQAEVKQLLHLMVNSLYSNREIFLRELVSNASDANDRLRFEALANPDLLGDSTELEIHIELDDENRLLTVSDNGIGMSREEIVEHLGTIAHSGTGRYLESLSGDQQKDAQLIGQFGVGFYSAFIVAEEVAVFSRRADLPSSEGVCWRSDGQGEYSVEALDKEQRGTTVQLKLRADADEFLDAARIRTLVRTYSDHIGFPILMQGDTEDKDKETINRAKALWARPRTDIDDDEYAEFYKHIAHDFTDPLVFSHNKVEGKREYTSLLYIPSVAPFDLWNRESPKGVKLYVQRVFITDQATQFLPLYLRFVRGVVDSSDLSLNVSREMLQQDPTVKAIKSALTKRVLDMLSKLASGEPDKYKIFWEQFGLVLKEGLAEDAGNQSKVAGLLRFNTTRSDGLAQDRSLTDYLDSAKPDQDRIYFLLAETPTGARSSPHLETFRERDIEVLLLSDRLDEWAIQHLTEYEGKSFKDIGRGELDLDASEDGEKPVASELDKEHKHVLKRIKRALREQIDEVRVSNRLKESAACIVLNEHDISHQMREIFKAAGQEAPVSKPSLEINLSHPLIQRLTNEGEDARFERLSALILDQAILVEGRQLEDPAAFVRRLNELLLEPGGSTEAVAQKAE